MPKPSAPPADDPGRDAYCRLHAHVLRVQEEACILNALVEGMAILNDHREGGNALGVILTIAQAKASEINRALDSVNLPKLDPLPS